MRVTAEEARAFVDLAFTQMLVKARSLGDDVTVAPDLDGANSVYALVVHSVGVCDFWLGHVVLGRESSRDRDAEFVATGSVDDLVAIVDDFLAGLEPMLVEVERADEPVRPAFDHDRRWPWTVGSIVLHVIEEVFQHAGHVDITADLLLVGRDGSRDATGSP